MASLIKMIRDKNEYPAPHTATVHPDAVADFELFGWKKVAMKARQPSARRKKVAAKRAVAKKNLAEKQADD